MIKSLFAGVSGMKNHQIRMDVIGNNIANVNTTGFKSGRVNFKDMLSQSINFNVAAQQDSNSNVNQVGIGVTVASTDNIYTQGGMVATGRETDLAIQGNGFFAVKYENEDTGDETVYYTRDGSFYIKYFDDTGYLVNALGYRVLDSEGNEIEFSGKITSLNIDRKGKISYTNADGETLPYDELPQIGLANIDNLEMLSKQGQNLYTYTTDKDLSEILGNSGEKGLGTIESCNLEMSNVDLTNEFSNMITTQRGYQANARVITTSDEMLQELMGLKR